MNRNDRFDFIRGIAVLLVIILHAALLTPGAEDYPRAIALLSRGSIGVQLFFVLSGILVYRSWLRSAQTGNPYLVYWTKRLAKIYPLYLVFMGLNIAVWAVSVSVWGQADQFRNYVTADNLTALNVLSHLLFLQGFDPSGLHTLVDGSWSIVNEIYFYALLPVFAVRVKKTRHWVWCYLVSLVLAIAVTIVIGRSSLNIQYYSYYNFLSHLPCFLLGVILARLLDDTGVRDFCRDYAGLLTAGASLLALGALRDDLRPLGYHHVYSLVFAVLILVLFARAELPRKLPGYALLARLGEQSYAIFFLHLLLLKLGTHFELVNWSSLGFPVLFAINLLGTVLGCYALSAFFFHRLDRYLVDLANTILARATFAKGGNAITSTRSVGQS